MENQYLFFAFNSVFTFLVFYFLHHRTVRNRLYLNEIQSITNKKLELTQKKISLLEKNFQMLFQTEEEINEIERNKKNKISDSQFLKRLKLYHLNLTEDEKQLCLAIYQDKTASKIATQKKSGFGKINQQKEKLKHKLGLHKQESITKYLKEFMN